MYGTVASIVPGETGKILPNWANIIPLYPFLNKTTQDKSNMFLLICQEKLRPHNKIRHFRNNHLFLRLFCGKNVKRGRSNFYFATAPFSYSLRKDPQQS